MMDLDKASEMWASGATMLEIGNHFGISRGAVAGLISRNRSLFPPKSKLLLKPRVEARGKPVVEYVEPLKTLGSPLIADEVISPLRKKSMSVMELKTYRDKLAAAYQDATGEDFKPSEGGEINVMIDQERKSRKSANAIRKLFSEATKPAQPIPSKAESEEYDNSRLPYAQTLAELPTTGCKWCLTDGGPFLMCAADRRKGKQYCEPHYQRAWRQA